MLQVLALGPIPGQYMKKIALQKLKILKLLDLRKFVKKKIFF